MPKLFVCVMAFYLFISHMAAMTIIQTITTWWMIIIFLKKKYLSIFITAYLTRNFLSYLKLILVFVILAFGLLHIDFLNTFLMEEKHCHL